MHSRSFRPVTPKTILCFSVLSFSLWGRQAPTGTKIDANTQIRNLPSGYNLIAFGAKPNINTFDSLPAIQQAANQAHNDGTCAVFVPPGIFYVSQGPDIPTCVEFYGVGFGQDTTFDSPLILGSVIQAMPIGFTGPSGYPTHFMLYIDGSPTVNGGTPQDTYNVNVHGITFSCGGLPGCGGFYIGRANEGVTVHNNLFSSFSAYGEYHCGAGLNSFAEWKNCGEQGAGPYYENQLVSYGSWVTSATIPLVVMEDFAAQWRNYTINTTPGPLYGAVVSGVQLSFDRFHFENSSTGFVIGPSFGPCTQLPIPSCIGFAIGSITNVSQGPTGNQYVIGNYNSQAITLAAIDSGGQTIAVLNDVQNGLTTPNEYLGWYYIQANGKNFSPEYGMQASGPFVTTNTITVKSAMDPGILLQYNGGVFPYHGIGETAGGELHISGSGGSRNVRFSDSWATLAVNGLETAYGGANMQAPLLATCSGGGACGAGDSVAHVNALWGSNIFFLPGVGGTGFTVGNIGGSGYSALWGAMNGGMGIATSNIGQPGFVTNGAFEGSTSFFVNNLGHTLIGANAYTGTDSGHALSVTGGATVDALYTPLTTPSSSSAACTASQIWADTGFLYVCTATNTIKRAALSGF